MPNDYIARRTQCERDSGDNDAVVDDRLAIAERIREEQELERGLEELQNQLQLLKIEQDRRRRVLVPG